MGRRAPVRAMGSLGPSGCRGHTNVDAKRPRQGKRRLHRRTKRIRSLADRLLAAAARHRSPSGP